MNVFAKSIVENIAHLFGQKKKTTKFRINE